MSSSPVSRVNLPFRGNCSLENDLVTSFWKSDNPDFLKQHFEKRDRYAAPDPLFVWEKQEDAVCYEIEIHSEQGNYSFVSDSASLRLPATFFHSASRYEIEIVAFDWHGRLLRKTCYLFETDDVAHCFQIEGVSNTRDLGGRVGLNKKRIRSGMVYRGGKLDDISVNGTKTFRSTLSIHTVLDLRNQEERKKAMEGVTTISNPGPFYLGQNGIDSPLMKDALVKEISFFADPHAYPIYFHCALGRDRTGTLAFLLEALLGVSLRDIRKDYDLSLFSSAGTFDGNDASMIETVHHSFDPMLAFFDTANLTKSVTTFLLRQGIQKKTISKIRDLLLH